MPDPEPDAIVIHELELAAHIGVPEEEREQAQRLTLSLTLWPRAQFHEMKDELAQTANYAALAQEVKEFVAARRDKLIETLADAIATHLLTSYPLRRVRVELRKFILPDTAYVAAVCER